MSYKAELEKHKALRDAEVANDQSAREKRDAACVKRAEELVAHLQKEDCASVGLKIEWENSNSHVRLRGEKFDIIIDVDVDDYSVYVIVPSKTRWGNRRSVLGPQHKRSTQAEIDILILDAIKTIQIPKN